MAGRILTYVRCITPVYAGYPGFACDPGPKSVCGGVPCFDCVGSQPNVDVAGITGFCSGAPEDFIGCYTFSSVCTPGDNADCTPGCTGQTCVWIWTCTSGCSGAAKFFHLRRREDNKTWQVRISDSFPQFGGNCVTYGFGACVGIFTGGGWIEVAVLSGPPVVSCVSGTLSATLSFSIPALSCGGSSGICTGSANAVATLAGC